MPGSRRDRYRLVDDSWYEVTLAKMTLLKTLVDVADDGIAAAGGPSTPAGARLAGMRDFYVFVQETMPDLMAQWAERKAPRAERRAPRAERKASRPSARLSAVSTSPAVPGDSHMVRWGARGAVVRHGGCCSV